MQEISVFGRVTAFISLFFLFDFVFVIFLHSLFSWFVIRFNRALENAIWISRELQGVLFLFT